jgi:hypothetical protein
MISQVTWETRVRSIPTKRVGCFHGANAPGIEKSHAFVLIPKDALFHGARFIKSSVFTLGTEFDTPRYTQCVYFHISMVTIEKVESQMGSS